MLRIQQEVVVMDLALALVPVCLQWTHSKDPRLTLLSFLLSVIMPTVT